MEPRTKTCGPWWFNFDPYPYANLMAHLMLETWGGLLRPARVYSLPELSGELRFPCILQARGGFLAVFAEFGRSLSHWADMCRHRSGLPGGQPRSCKGEDQSGRTMLGPVPPAAWHAEKAKRAKLDFLALPSRFEWIECKSAVQRGSWAAAQLLRV